MHRYRSHTCGALRESDIGTEARLSGWCHRIRDHGGVLFIDLRDHYGLTQVVADPDSPAFKVAETLRSEWVVRVDGKVRRRPGGTENPDLPTGAIEVYISEIEVLGPAGELPMPVFGDQEYPEEIKAQIPLPRSAPRAPAPEHHEARPGHRFDPAAHEGAGLLRIPDADPHRLVARRRARLSGAVAHPSGKILRAAAGAAAVQAAHHGVGLRPLFPDRAVLSRRGRARRPLARRVLSARPGDELCHPGGRVRRGRAGDARRVRGIFRRQAGDAEISAHPLCRGARANTAPTSRICAIRSSCRTCRRFSAARDSRFSRGFWRPAPRPRCGLFRRRRRLARILRPHEFLGAGRRPARARLYLLCARQRRRGRPRPGRQQSRRRNEPRRCARSSA